jgi:hypothetical protein
MALPAASCAAQAMPEALLFSCAGDWRLAAVGHDSVLVHMIYSGGSGEAPMTRGQAYDLRFLADRLMISLSAFAVDVTELSYHDVEAVEVSGSDRGKSAGEKAAWISALALAGALLGLLLLGLLGGLLGALLFGLIAGLLTASSGTTKAILRLRGHDAEFFFSTTKKAPDALRIELSGPLKTITGTRATGRSGSRQLAAQVSGSIPDQLSKLASLLADGVLSREEFEHLKAQVIARA